MNDYRDLITTLREKQSRDNRGLLNYAANAIEQTVKERNAVIKDLKYVLNYAETMTHCKFCAHDKGPFETCGRECIDGSQFEYRGVQGVQNNECPLKGGDE